MSWILIAILCLGSFYSAFAHAYRNARSEDPNYVYGIAPLAIAGLAFIAIFGIANYVIGAYGGGFLLIALAVVVLPVFLFGLGRMLGNWTALLQRVPLLQTTLAVLALGWPFLLGYEVYSIRQDRNDKALAYVLDLKAFQKTTIKGRIGRHPITLPVSPQINAYYTCFPPDRDIAGQCRTHFRFTAGLKHLKGNAPVFNQLVFAARHEDCNSARCIDTESFKTWCQARPDLAFSEWCQIKETREITFDYDERRSKDDNYRDWQRVDVLDDDAVTLECAPSERQRHCRATFEIARNLEAQIWLIDVPDADLKAEVTVSQATAVGLWEAMQPDG